MDGFLRFPFSPIEIVWSQSQVSSTGGGCSEGVRFVKSSCQVNGSDNTAGPAPPLGGKGRSFWKGVREVSVSFCGQDLVGMFATSLMFRMFTMSEWPHGENAQEGIDVALENHPKSLDLGKLWRPPGVEGYAPSCQGWLKVLKVGFRNQMWSSQITYWRGKDRTAKSSLVVGSNFNHTRNRIKAWWPSLGIGMKN